jgi:hypothetical protein
MFAALANDPIRTRAPAVTNRRLRGAPCVEFLKDQYRYAKPMLALGAGLELLAKAGVSPALPSGRPDPGVLVGARRRRQGRCCPRS